MATVLCILAKQRGDVNFVQQSMYYPMTDALTDQDSESYRLFKDGPYAAHGRRDPQARIYRRRDGEPWQPLTGGLPEPLPAMPYALLAADGRLFAGLADGQLWESRDRGDNWTALQLGGDTLEALLALDHATR